MRISSDQLELLQIEVDKLDYDGRIIMQDLIDAYRFRADLADFDDAQEVRRAIEQAYEDGAEDAREGTDPDV